MKSLTAKMAHAIEVSTKQSNLIIPWIFEIKNTLSAHTVGPVLYLGILFL